MGICDASIPYKLQEGTVDFPLPTFDKDNLEVPAPLRRSRG